MEKQHFSNEKYGSPQTGKNTKNQERTFSYSKILDYASCPRKYYLRNVLRLVPIAKAKPLAFGSCSSKGVEAFRLTGSIKAAQEAFAATWKKEGRILIPVADPENPKDFRTVERGLELMKAFAEEYPTDPAQVVKFKEKGAEIKFEKVFLANINGIDIFLNGRIDAVYKINEDIYVAEDKTTSRLGDTFLPILSGSLQIGIYLWIADTLGLFSIGDKKKAPKCLMTAMRVHPTEFKFKRDVTIKSRPHLEQVKQNAIRWINRILLSEKDDCFPMNDADNSMCTMYGGCDYLPLRYVEGSLRETLIKNEYRIKETRKKEDKK